LRVLRFKVKAEGAEMRAMIGNKPRFGVNGVQKRSDIRISAEDFRVLPDDTLIRFNQDSPWLYGLSTLTIITNHYQKRLLFDDSRF